jgi:hypothetical protein
VHSVTHSIAAELEFEIVPAPVHTIYYFWAIYRVENLPPKDLLSGGSKYCRSFSLSAVPGEMTADVFAGHRSIYLQFEFIAVSKNVILWCHKSSQVHKFIDNLEIPVAKSHSSSGVEIRPISSRYHVFCLLFVDLHPYFCWFCLQC